MDAFFRGMAMVGQIYPPPRETPETNWASAWQGVGDAFTEAGKSLRWALDEFAKERETDGQQRQYVPDHRNPRRAILRTAPLT